MSTTVESQIASVLSVLSENSEETSGCPLSIFARDLRKLLTQQQQAEGSVNLGDALAERATELVKEEEQINSNKEIITLTYDKLRAELTRVEAQLQVQERQLVEVSHQKRLCKAALNMLVSGDIPFFVTDTARGESSLYTDHTKRSAAQVHDDGRDDGELQPSKAAPEPVPMKGATSTASSSQTKGTLSSKNGPEGEPNFHPPHHANNRESKAPRDNASAPTASSRVWETAGGGSTQRLTNSVSGTTLVAMLKIPDVKESALLNGIEAYDQDALSRNNQWMGADAYGDVLTTLLALLSHLPQPRPPVQLAELRVLGRVLQASPTSNQTYNRNLLTMLESLVKKGDAVPILTKLLNSVNDDVKSEVLECLSPLVCGSHLLVTAASSSTVSATARKQFLTHGGLDPLVNIVMCSTSEVVLERALVLLWGLLSRDEKSDAVYNGGKSVRSQVRELGGLRAVLDLLYTDSLAILENVCMVIGYITREDTSKKEIREIGGLEKITATLRHPSDSIKTKMAGAVWNCASNPENRAYLSQLGAIPALLELLRQKSGQSDDAAYEFVRENAAGALWNLSVDADNKSQILDYGGVPVLINALSSSNSVSVVENVSGTLWNCSASVEARPLIRKAGGIQVLLSLLNDRKPLAGTRAAAAVNSTMPFSEKVLDNVAGTLRNCAINDQNKPVICEAGGVELLLRKIKDTLLSGGNADGGASVMSTNTVDKMASTLWILTISPEIKHTVRLAGGIETITDILERSSPVISAIGDRNSKTLSLFSSTNGTSASTKAAASLRAEDYAAQYSAAALSRIPSTQPSLMVPMNIKEKLVGVLRNCSTVTENRVPMIDAGVIRCLTAVVIDCYSSHSIFQSAGNHKNGSRLREPSVQLQETVASALWYLARDDKVAPCEQGGLELMCMLLSTPQPQSPQQPSVVLEQAAGALSSMSVNNAENRDAIRTHGGLLALMRLVETKAPTEYPIRGTEGGKREGVSHTYVVLNALLAIRNCTVNSVENLKYCGEVAQESGFAFAQKLLYVVENGSEEAAREAALTVKIFCGLPHVLDYFTKQNASRVMSALSERASSDTVRRAAASALQAVAKGQKAAKQPMT